MARAYPSGSRMPCPKLDQSFDSLMLVILDDKTMNAREIWEASYDSVCECVSRFDARSRAKGLPIPKFKEVAKRVLRKLYPSYQRRSA